MVRKINWLCTIPLGAGCALPLSSAQAGLAWALRSELLPHAFAVRGVTCRWGTGVLEAE